MGKKLAIKGHPTRGKEVIELLKMMGGKNNCNSTGDNLGLCYLIDDETDIVRQSVGYVDYEDGGLNIFTLEEFLEKYPFKVGDKVQVLKSGNVFTIGNMIWDDEVCDIYYYNTDDIEYYNAEELKLYKETDTVKPVTNKSERTHEDVIFDSIIWHLRNSVNNGKQNLSGGECEDYFREVVKKNNENKMSDCKKCGLGFGSVRCFDKNCPHNTPKSYAVGLKDGKIIECGVNKEIVMNENKPLFKTGDVVKLKGCPDKNLFWIVMDVIEDGYIFNDGKKYSFDDQHHYEKSNREVINAPDITAKVTDKNHKMGPKSKLPSKYYEDRLEETQPKREYDELRMPLDDEDKLATEATIMGKKILPPDGYLVGKITQTDNGMLVEYVNKKSKYPKTYKECCYVLLIPPYYKLRYHTYEPSYDEYATSNDLLSLQDKLNTLGKLLICRDAYWKVAGEEMGLSKPWEPDWCNEEQDKYCISYGDGNIQKNTWRIYNTILAFPTEEMRDAFYDNFKDLIEKCKELL